MEGLSNPDLRVFAWTAIILYMCAIIFFVIRGALRTKNISDYAVGSMNFSPVAVGLALAASITSAATFIINPGFVALYGISAFLSFGIFLPFSALIALAVLSKGFRKYGEQIKALTLAQWIGKRYNSPGLTLFFGFLSLLLITFIVLICVGLTKIISKTLDVSEINVLIGIIVFVFGYMMFGGANSMIYTNTVQAILMVAVAIILLGSGYDHFRNGVQGFINNLNSIDPKLSAFTNESSFLFRDFFEIVIVPMIVGVAIMCQPHILTKALMLKTNKDVNKYLAVGIITEALFFLVVFTGFYARFTFPDLTVNGRPLKMDGILSAYVVNKFSVYVAIVVVLGLISAGLSTLEGLIQAIASTITADIIEPFFDKKFSFDEKKKEIRGIIINRFAIVILAVVSLYLTYDQLISPKLSVGIFAQNGVYAFFAAAFVPISFGIYLKNVRKIVPIVASLVAVVVHFSMYYGKLPVPFSRATGENPGVAAAAAIIFSLAAGFLLYFFDHKKEVNN